MSATFDDWVPPTPAAVTVALAAGVAPLPFLAVYSVLLIVHGSVHPVHPPDVTSTKGGELVVGLIMFGVLIATIVGLVMLLNRSRRWPHALVQLAVLVAGVEFLLSSTVGGRPVSALLVLTSFVSLFFVFAPAAWQHVGRTAPAALVRAYATVRLAPRPASAAHPPSLEQRPAEPALLEPAPIEPAPVERAPTRPGPERIVPRRRPGPRR